MFFSIYLTFDYTWEGGGEMGLAGIKGSHRGTEGTEGIIGGLTDIFTQRRRGRGGFFRTAEKFSLGGHGDTENFLTA